jgi:hypothetical protein
MAYGGNLHINKALTNLSIQYKNADYIAQAICRDIPVLKESDSYYVYVRDFRTPETRRANGAPANMVTWGVSLGSYSCEEHALADIVTDRSRRNSDTIQLDADTTEFLTDKILQAFEKDVADLYFTTGTWSNYAALDTASSWYKNTTTSAPIQNVLSGTSKIIMSSGKRPNTLILGLAGFDALKENSNVYGRIQYVERAIMTESLLAAVFDIENVFVGRAVRDAGEEGVAESITAIWGNHALLAFFDPNPGIKKVTAAGNFRVNEGGNPYKVKKWREEKVGGDYIEVSTIYKPAAIATSCAYYFSSVTSA